MTYTDLLKSWIDVLLHPDKATRKALSVKEALKAYYSLAIIPIVLGAIMMYAFGGIYISSQALTPVMPGFAGLVKGSVLAIAAGIGLLMAVVLVALPLGILVNSALYHVVISKLFKIYNKDYSRAFTAFFYGSLPVMLMYWLYPAGAIGSVILAFIGLWGYWVELVAMSNQLGMSPLKAFGTYLLYVVTIGIIFVVLAMLAAFLMFAKII